MELRAPNGDVLAQTYVRAGESYVVPAGIAYRIIDAALEPHRQARNAVRACGPLAG